MKWLQVMLLTSPPQVIKTLQRKGQQPMMTTTLPQVRKTLKREKLMIRRPSALTHCGTNARIVTTALAILQEERKDVQPVRMSSRTAASARSKSPILNLPLTPTARLPSGNPQCGTIEVMSTLPPIPRTLLEKTGSSSLRPRPQSSCGSTPTGPGSAA